MDDADHPPPDRNAAIEAASAKLEDLNRRLDVYEAQQFLRQGQSFDPDALMRALQAGRSE